MSQTSVTEFLAAAKKDQALRQKLKAAMDTHGCVKIGKDSGYEFTAEELQTQLNSMSEEEVAEIVNPGVAPRRHIDPQ
ncbi:Nif11-like leader peptide family natural product precursor [Fischerella sp. JS2]|uniref:Nif11-like leader peptide family natural product precursor n=1 Tax=Fischerella sp. JS2 TaxID=2597771 RepID=UPI0028E6A2C8|nr:Nif11-like leader peptide family natural product precursor [Fischerella sp. JS2]